MWADELNRRALLKLFALGGAAVVAERVFPFRVFSFPQTQAGAESMVILPPPTLDRLFRRTEAPDVVAIPIEWTDLTSAVRKNSLQLASLDEQRRLVR